jgi:acetylglutamate kinase
MQPLVLKFGGELLEEPSRMAGVVAAIADIVKGSATNGVPVVIVHGGGKEIDAALKTAGIEKRQVDGLRITDAATLDIVVSVLAGAVNTGFVASLGAAGVPAVGLTGADGGCGLSELAPQSWPTWGAWDCRPPTPTCGCSKRCCGPGWFRLWRASASTGADSS